LDAARFVPRPIGIIGQSGSSQSGTVTNAPLATAVRNNRPGEKAYGLMPSLQQMLSRRLSAGLVVHHNRTYAFPPPSGD